MIQLSHRRHAARGHGQRHRDGQEGGRRHGPRRAGDRRDRDRPDPRKAGRRQAAAASSSTASRARWRRPTRWASCWPRWARRLDAVIEMQVDDEALVDGSPRARPARSCGEVYNDITKPIPDGRQMHQLRRHRVQAPRRRQRGSLQDAADGILQEDLAADRLLLRQGHADARRRPGQIERSQPRSPKCSTPEIGSMLGGRASALHERPRAGLDALVQIPLTSTISQGNRLIAGLAHTPQSIT